ncbi:RING finger protein 214 [Merluccius polli]|uniref:RING finger protein 214 n=1 Tax=Merluccius polli TaxID=89951 RepID=A0AA47NSC5_MERPO|nr:RING finger protein 214 [Merluccius polli]
MTYMDWQHYTETMAEPLLELYKRPRSQQEQEEEERQEERRLQLQKKQENTVKHHQVLLEKLDSLRVKLQLNDSKASRKSFLLKKQEMTSQKNRAQEENNRLQKNLQQIEERLSSLQVKQEQEKRLLEEELSQLTEEMERMRQTSQEAEQRMLKDEVVAVEKQRDGTMFSIEAWLREVGQYIQALQMDPSQQHLQEQLQWEQQEATVRTRRDQLQVRFQGLLLQLGEGRPLDTLHGVETLPGMELPPLPKVPTVSTVVIQKEVELIISQILLSLEQATFLPPPHPTPSPPVAPPRTPPPPRITPPTGHQTPPLPRITPPTGYQTPPYCISQPTGHQTPPPYRITQPTGHQTPPPHRITQPTGHQTPPPHRITQPPGHQTPPPYCISQPTGHQTPPPSSAPAGKLDKLLEKLGAKFPHCSRAQLMSVLQHIKSSRGTMAGLSVEEVTEQVGLKLAQGTALRGPALPQPPAPRPTVRTFCLVCQKQLQPGTQQPLPCSHSIHRDCIRIWLQSSGNNSCPFCPSQ